MSSVFKTERRVRHGHTDPAGFMFYPRYYEMIAGVIEDFFRLELNLPFGEMHLKQRIGMPTVNIETNFYAPSFCDDVLEFSLLVEKIGRASATLQITATCGSERRLCSRQTIANVMLDEVKAVPFSADLREGLLGFLAREDSSI